ncbi:MAG: DUF814 domain-containing protein, partial [Clostridia bacterium]|nr:DUF814 domain-containing protein [Clostridia bacterium]
IIVDRDSKKGIIIGKGGSMLKKIGSAARATIEDLLGYKIYLELFVRVEKDWKNSNRYLKEFGYKNEDYVLTEQISIWERELSYLSSVRDALSRAECEQDVLEIRDELYRSGYASRLRGYKPDKQKKIAPKKFLTTDGKTVLVGRNNTQNDYLTFKLSDKGDIWFHVKDMPGSHVILVTEGEEPTDRDYTEAAELAAYHSTATGEGVEVDYTRVKNVKKPQGSKPGYVIYKTNYTAYVKRPLDLSKFRAE